MLRTRIEQWVIGAGLAIGLIGLGSLLVYAAVIVKEYERTVTVKGLSEREFAADVVIWPIQYTVASNELDDLYQQLEDNNSKVQMFLSEWEIDAKTISVAEPSIVDKSAQQYGGYEPALFRYSAGQTVTVYSRDIATVRQAQSQLSQLGKQGIVLSGGDYGNQTEYLFTRLNEIKPAMVEEATQNARQVAKKFAEDSVSRLGKIKRASQGQFSIAARDRNNPHLKKVRVVSTVEYYLVD
ncbi:SIMPL domain-containing protein [Thaumasiovibrio sp. DFM-14]|uniref:SIMPL domain-containing protein n=1 Tax=Thaumasiovibrio sp. DFM-14 TaxID=3384792 RepID=UPI0039A330E2